MQSGSPDLPEGRLEPRGAVDASGYRTTSFEAYCQEAHGPSRTNVWKKAHVIVGTATHVVAGAVVTEGTGADVVQFAPLLRHVRDAGCSVLEVCADTAYLSRANVEAVTEVGARPYIPLKSSSIERSHGSAGWAELYCLFEEHREEVEAHFLRRSNVEAVFAAIKKKLGETLKSRDPTAQIHELLAKLLAYNLTVPIHGMYEHRVIPEFLQANSVPREIAPCGEVIGDFFYKAPLPKKQDKHSPITWEPCRPLDSQADPFGSQLPPS